RPVLRRLSTLLALVLVLALALPALADDKKGAEEIATRYVVALESGRFAEARELAVGAAASWAEYAEAMGEKPSGPATLVSCESAQFSGYHLVKVVFKAQSGEFGVRYVKVARSPDGKWQVTDDGKRGRRWASDTFLPGVIFKEPGEIDGLRVSVAALLELPAEVKFDIVIENTQDREVAIYPQLEAYYTVETAKFRKTYYYPIAVKNNIDGPVPAKSTKRGFILFPSFVRDFAPQDPNLEGLKWILYIPYGVDKQFVFSR
ncbi:MAG: hypothetical protein AB1497_12715, partial [Bacillota bacterium]